MENKLLKQTMLKLWKGRLMMCWRSIAIGMFAVYMCFWAVFPFLQGVAYFNAKPPSEFLGVLCILAGITSVSFMLSGGNFIGNKTIDRFYGEREDLKIAIRRIKHAIDLLKDMRTEELTTYSLRELQNILNDIGVDATPIDTVLQEVAERENSIRLNKAMGEKLRKQYLDMGITKFVNYRDDSTSDAQLSIEDYED